MLKQKISQWNIDLSKKLSRQGLIPFLAHEFDAIPANTAVLTIGAGGEIHQLLSQFSVQNNFSILSFDIDPERKPDLIGDICTYNFQAEQFDVIVMSEVLEHVYAPHLALKVIHLALKENGRLILTTPFIFPLHDRPHDYFRYTKFGLKYLLRHFAEVSIKERNSYFEAIDVLWVRLWREEEKKARLLAQLLIPIIFFLKHPFSFLLSKIIKADGMTTGYLVIAKK